MFKLSFVKTLQQYSWCSFVTFSEPTNMDALMMKIKRKIVSSYKSVSQFGPTLLWECEIIDFKMWTHTEHTLDAKSVINITLMDAAKFVLLFWSAWEKKMQQTIHSSVQEIFHYRVQQRFHCIFCCFAWRPQKTLE